MTLGGLEAQADLLVAKVAAATAASPNEENLRHEIEKALQDSCHMAGITWTAYQLDRTLRGTTKSRIRFTDVAHGGVVIEYEPPKSFRGGTAAATFAHARSQVEEYAELLSEEEGRPLAEYVLIAWDGAHLAFGRRNLDDVEWEPLTPFGTSAARRILELLRDNGSPLVHPRLLSQVVGPDSVLGSKLLPKLYLAVTAATKQSAHTTETKLLFSEWRRLFGQVVGVQSERLRRLLNSQGNAHGQSYAEEPAAYLYALNTYIALVAKLVAAMSLPNPAQDVTDANVPIANRIDLLESGTLFADAGVVNMLNGDFFTWYRDDNDWQSYANDIADIVDALRAINFNVSLVSSGRRDTGIEQQFV